LARLVELNGIRKIKGRQSTVTVQCVGTTGTVIPQNALIRSDTNDQFKIDEFGVIGIDGFVDMPASSVEIGPIVALANSIRKIDTPVFGWQGVVNFFDAIPGRLEETDEQLRIRRRGATTTPAQSLLDSLYGALSNLPDVIQAKCYENFTGVQDANGLPPHSEYAIVNGGDEQEIFEIIWLKKGAGTTLHGTISGEVIDSAGISHTIRFSRPTPVLVYLDIAISKRIGWPTDGETRIKESLVEWAFANQEIGEELILSRLYEPINKIPGHSVTSLFAGLSQNPTSASNISILFDALINLDTSRISITTT